MIRIALIALLALQGQEVKPRYAVEKGEKDRIYTEIKLAIKIEGSDAIANYVRSMHPFLSMEKIQLRAEGTRQILSKNKYKYEHEESRVELRYDDADHEYDYVKGQPPEGDKDKLRQIMWYLAAAGRGYSLTAEGEYRSDDLTHDASQEAMDLYALGITRMPDKALKQGDTYEKQFKGLRTEKGKKSKFAFKQKVTVEKIEDRDGKQVATLASELTGKLEGGEKDPAAEEAWTKTEGKTRTLIEVQTGRVISSEGAGKVVTYFRNTAENGQKQELTMSFSIEGKTTLKN